MGMTPSDFLEAFVVGNQADYHANRDSVRHAFNAAVAASHMADHYFKYHAPHSSSNRFGSLRELIDHMNAVTDGAFKNIRSIADAYKHLYLTRHDPDISSAGAVESIIMPANQGDVAELVAEEEHGVATVRFTTRDGQIKEFGPVLDVVVRAWEGIMGIR